jgi:hypothetical protein
MHLLAVLETLKVVRPGNCLMGFTGRLAGARTIASTDRVSTLQWRS